tara:strand:+ start:1060 stop:1479 length:420 start_codon:yes stop_codon:yes gene_type:complete
MKQAKVRKGTVAFLKDDLHLPFINLANSKFNTMKDVYTIPHYWRDRDGKMSHLWHLDYLPRNTKVTCTHRERGMKHTFWAVTDPESDSIGKVFVVGFRFDDRFEMEDELSFQYENISPFVKYSLLSEKYLTKKQAKVML